MKIVLAYLEPGTGSMVLQIIAGGLAAVAVAAKFYWRRLLRLLGVGRGERKPVPGEGEKGARRPEPPRERGPTT
jgi:hypothetical protein